MKQYSLVKNTNQLLQIKQIDFFGGGLGEENLLPPTSPKSWFSTNRLTDNLN
ncbi:hypothetical protein NIES4101_50040 [Calothrix sp. NIES-4101]|nr:hypothetical protein NIES4101_50040 [Calothrix sp. NIES-4101]